MLLSVRPRSQGFLVVRSLLGDRFRGIVTRGRLIPEKRWQEHCLHTTYLSCYWRMHGLLAFWYLALHNRPR